MTDPQATALQTLLATHAAVLQPLLGELWPVRPFKVEQFGPLTKYTLGQMPSGDWAMLHYLVEPDTGPPHDHPVLMESHIIAGGYYERRFRLDADGNAAPYRVTLRMPGETYLIEADCIHSIIGLAAGPAWSLCFAGPVVREWQHYHEAAVQLPLTAPGSPSRPASPAARRRRARAGVGRGCEMWISYCAIVGYMYKLL